MFKEAREALTNALVDGPKPNSEGINASVRAAWPNELEVATMAVISRPAGTASLVLGHGQTFRTWRIAIDVALLVPSDTPNADEVLEDLIEYMLYFVNESDYGLIGVDSIATGEWKGGNFTHTRVHLSVQSKS